MRSVIYSFAFLSTINSFGQDLDSTKIKQTLPEVVVTNSDLETGYKEIDLTKYRTYRTAFLDCTDNVGLFVPQSVSSTITIKSLDFPIKDNGKGRPFDMKFFVVLPFQEGNSVVELKKQKEKHKKNNHHYTFDQILPLREKINGFYVFMRYDCVTPPNNIQIKYTSKVKPKLTYTYKETKAEVKDMREAYRASAAEFFKNDFFPNWKAKVIYSVD